MRFEGEMVDVKLIERVVRDKAIVVNRPQRNYDKTFGIESKVQTQVIDVLSHGGPMFPLRFFYDERNGAASIDVRDKDVPHLCHVSLNMVKLLERLERQEKTNGSHPAPERR